MDKFSYSETAAKTKIFLYFALLFLNILHFPTTHLTASRKIVFSIFYSLQLSCGLNPAIKKQAKLLHCM